MYFFQPGDAHLFEMMFDLKTGKVSSLPNVTIEPDKPLRAPAERINLPSAASNRALPAGFMYVIGKKVLFHTELIHYLLKLKEIQPIGILKAQMF